MDLPRYDPASPLKPLTEAELDGLERLLAKLPSDAAMTLDGADGFLTALLVGPPELLREQHTADWLPWVWGGDADGDDEEPAVFPFASRRQRKDTVVLLLRHLRHLGALLAVPEAPGWEPVFSIAEHEGEELADARDWCAGFLQAVDLAPQAWGEACWADPATMPLLQLGGGLDGVEPAEPAPSEDDLPAIDAISRAVPEAVLALRARWHG